MLSKKIGMSPFLAAFISAISVSRALEAGKGHGLSLMNKALDCIRERNKKMDSAN